MVAAPRALSAVALVPLCALLLMSCAFFDPRSVLDPQTDFGSDVFLLPETEAPTDVTASVCANIDGCERAAESQRVRILRFANTDRAEVVARSLGSAGYLSDRFVIEYLDPSVTDEQRRYVESAVDHTATWDSD
ncbi:hypothetical protein KNO15_16800 [Leifsonia shinshuensis]|uniref:hypothetical protein n=1 Tax=Leifsonia shinshuensis TaxID=150026 RepID=UPI001F5137E7|nr:hypothetical protein [Leifsonia shinshuensis]MCI0158362.1 hypothetical protein [Leifsonia shinshuensis]